MKGKFVFLLLMLFVLFSCTKTENNSFDDYKHRAVPIEVENNLKNFTTYASGGYSLTSYFGHSASGCSGCITFEGKPIHIDCMGPGGVCTKVVAVMVYSSGASSYKAATTTKYDLTDGDIFYMPDRSFFVQEKESKQLWLNIPEQLSIRDTSTMQFTFDDVFFSTYQVYNND
ncbi:MAG: hypothetical protein LBQ22_07100 [Bacteroidales bacterium]|nr:hypothetical protein [Bacteroidales bacterium]